MFSKVIFLTFLLFTIMCAQGRLLIYGDINEYYGDKWNGLIPHFQPFTTTDYYGSGDINLDTKLDQTDLNELRKIFSGSKQPNIRSDINGDGSVTSADEQLIITALNGGMLPGWWNFLQSKDERISWLRKMLALDKTNEHPYITGKYECSNFASQLFRNFTGYDVLLDYTSQTIYNLPVYYVLIDPPYGTPHNLNAILVGDDPCYFSDWLFIEPQNDQLVTLNNYPAGTEISIMPLKSFPVIVFEYSSFGKMEVKSCISSLVRNKPSVQPKLKNNIYTWYPELLPNKRILFEKATDDMSRVFKLHLCNLDSLSQVSGFPLTSSSNRTHRILTKSRRDGSTDIIWEESYNDSSSYYFGSISDKNQLVNIQELTFLKNNGFHSIDLYITESKALMFWLSNQQDNLNKMFYSEMIDNKWKVINYIQLAKSDYPVAQYKVGEDQYGILQLFTTVRNGPYKLVVYSLDNNWKNTYRIEYVIGKDIFFADNKFFISGWRVPDKASDIAIYSKTDTGWNVKFSVFYGIPIKIFGTGILRVPLYIVGTSKYDENYYFESAFIRDSYITTDQSLHEFNVADNLSVCIDDKTVRAAWYNQSEHRIDHFSYNIGVTLVTENKDTEADTLFQNYPNPFNSETEIRYFLKAPDFVNIKIYDILGREVIELNNKWESTGEHVINFNGNNFGSGIYLFEMRTSHRRYFRKMILAK